ncbi:hypothetical protein BGZ94_001995, partial [Podila epigama]
VKEDFENHRAAKSEFKEIRRYVDIWNDTVEKQLASNPTKSFKKFVPFFGPKPPSYAKTADAHMANARTFVGGLEDIGNLSDIKMDTIADTSSELVIYTAKFKDAYNALSHTLEVLHKKSRTLKKKKAALLEQLFDERCKIFSQELQAHYRSVGASLAAHGAQEQDHANPSRLPIHRHHVESIIETHSSEGMSHGHSTEELLLDTEELPSYFQYENDANAMASTHRRTGSVESSVRSSSASSSLSLNSPHTGYVESPPDYVRDEPRSSSSSSPRVRATATVTTTVTVSGTGTGTGTSETTAPLVPLSGTEVGVEEDAMFRAYHQRYDTAHHRRRQDSDPRSRLAIAVAMDMPPSYHETRYTVVDPV